jgi:hypothetical protein
MMKLDMHEVKGESGTRPLFRALRIASYAIIAITVGVYVVNLPAFYAALRTVCADPCSSLQLTSAQFAALSARGISIDAYAAYFLGVRILFVTVFALVALLLLLYRSGDGLALFVAVMLVTFAFAGVANELSLFEQAYPLLKLPVQLLGFIMTGR